jgi:hypothetical protein
MNKGYSFEGKLRYYPELYVSQKRQDNGPNLGFMTHKENNAAFAKRKITADAWANNLELVRDQDGRPIEDNTAPLDRWGRKSWLYHPTLPALTLSNDPIDGFKVSNNVIRRYSTSNVLWRVEDPRGFELEIASENLNYLIQESGIAKGGVIEPRCVWVRMGSNNYLIPEGTYLFPQI